jgi:poly(3-hydroxybutyrate) depolymerase
MTIVRLLSLISAAVFFLPLAHAAETLPPLGADLRQTSVTGLSSGGYMAGQFHTAHSKYVKGAAIIGAGPYACARSGVADSTSIFAIVLAANFTQAETGCMKATLSRIANVLDGKRLASFAADLASKGDIDPLDGLKRGKVYLYSGKDDIIVDTKVVATARDFYSEAGVPSQQIVFISDKEGGHAFISDTAGNTCSSNKPPFIDRCPYDQAGAILNHIYGSLSPRGKADAGSFVTFDQSPFVGKDANLAAEGVAYIPKACRENRGCKVHVVFHGCSQSKNDVGDAVTHETGFADWAETNNIVVLFPQAAPSTLNPMTCWDWWGYTGLSFYTRDAPQINAVDAMIAAVTKSPQ